MKKILPIVLLLMGLGVQGCVIGFPSFTTDCGPYPGPPGANWVARYPDGQTTGGTVGPSGTFKVKPRGFDCATIMVLVGSSFGLALSASPTSVYLPSPPATGTITGQQFDATHGMPVVEYFDSNGFLVGSAYASSVSGDGTWLQGYLPDLSNAYSGNYSIKVTNKRSDGYYLNVVGTATVTAWGRDRPDSDGDGWYDDEDCAPYDPFMATNCIQTCGGTPTEHLTICPN